MNDFPRSVTVVEVGPRDGLQNEAAIIETALKVEFIDRLTACGLPVIETGAMVDPRRVPQLADSETVCRRIVRREGVSYPVLVPNMRGLERALAVGARAIALITAASETFNLKNIHCTIDESVQRYLPVIAQARSLDIRVRAYISCALGCPYEGAIAPGTVAGLAQRLYAAGCDEIALGDTIGIGTPLQARRMVDTVAGQVPMERLAIHFHDTRGQALANILACLELGITTVDAAVTGLGGCPFAPGAAGNVATEDLVYMLEGMGIDTRVDLDSLVEAGRFICARLGRENGSRVGRTGGAYAIRK